MNTDQLAWLQTRFRHLKKGSSDHRQNDNREVDLIHDDTVLLSLSRTDIELVTTQSNHSCWRTLSSRHHSRDSGTHGKTTRRTVAGINVTLNAARHPALLVEYDIP